MLFRSMFGELLAPRYLHWLFDGFVLTLILSLLTCLVATGLGFAMDVTSLPVDTRKEIGPDPRLSYLPFPARHARQLVLAAEGPIGLGFDHEGG